MSGIIVVMTISFFKALRVIQYLQLNGHLRLLFLFSNIEITMISTGFKVRDMKKKSA